jgi:hypothetical protein
MQHNRISSLNVKSLGLIKKKINSKKFTNSWLTSPLMKNKEFLTKSLSIKMEYFA